MTCLLVISSLVFAETKGKKEKLPPMSKETEACIGCHKLYSPGIVEDWMKSLHSKTTPSIALKKPELKRHPIKVSRRKTGNS